MNETLWSIVKWAMLVYLLMGYACFAHLVYTLIKKDDEKDLPDQI